VDTNDDHKVNCIHSVVKPGYEIRITEKEKRILKKAEVKVYSKEEKQ
jgi:molecular chaperone GrpE (heat shock protein)